MSARDHGRNHAFFSSRNRDLLASSLEFSRPYKDGDAIAVRVATRGVGHRFPTGDIFRRLSITLVGIDTSAHVVCGETFQIGRNWAAHTQSIRTNTEETLDDDNRLTNEPRVFRAACSGAVSDVQVSAEYARGRNADGEQFNAFETYQLFEQSYRL